MVCTATAVLGVECFPDLEFVDIPSFFLLLHILTGLSIILLIFAVLKIRAIVKKIGHGLPNETFLRTHFMLFVIAGTLQLGAITIGSIIHFNIKSIEKRDENA